MAVWLLNHSLYPVTLQKIKKVLGATPTVTWVRNQAHARYRYTPSAIVAYGMVAFLLAKPFLTDG